MSSAAPTVSGYRTLVPAHAGVAGTVVQSWLDMAMEAHTSAEWGDQYDTAMIWWAAHHIEVDHFREGSAVGAVGALTDVSDSVTEGGKTITRRRAYTGPKTRDPEDEEMATTKYGARYLRIRGSRAMGAPYALGPG